MRALQDRIKQLETTARENISAKAKVFDKLSSERGRHMPNGVLLILHVNKFCSSPARMSSLSLELSEKLDGELRELRASHCQLQKEHQQLQEKMKFFSKVGCTCLLSLSLSLSVCLSVWLLLIVCLSFILSLGCSLHTGEFCGLGGGRGGIAASEGGKREGEREWEGEGSRAPPFPGES